MFLTNWCVDAPFICCCSAYIILIAVGAVAFYMSYFDINEQNYREYALWDNQRIIDWDMQEAAKLQLLKSDDEESKKPVRSEKMTTLKSVILY